MKIAQVSPLFEAVPPKLYGGTERIIAFLTDELVALGHDVTLFASGDSRTRAKLIPVWPSALRLGGSAGDNIAPHIVELEFVSRMASQFDIIHFHVDYLAFPFMRQLGVPALSTLHGRLDLPYLGPVYDTFGDAAVVSISEAQRQPVPQANFVGTVHHGLPESLLRPGSGKGGYVAFLGRISPEKAPDTAIRIARRAGVHLKIAAKVDGADQAYFEQRIAPLLDQPGIEYVGEIDDSQKGEFLGNADAVLFPIDWPEPFGIVMIEAMACGTPVVAFRRGSVPEVLEDGVTGFVVDDEDQAVAALGHVRNLNRARVRRQFEERFTARRMARDYLAIYAKRIAASAAELEVA